MFYRELTAEEQSNITAPLIQSKGAHFQKYIAIKPENIYIRKNEKGGNNNLVRKQMNYGVCNAIKESYLQNGQLLHLPIPVVKETNPFVSDGTRYNIIGVDIHHRHVGAIEADLPELICAVYTFDDEQAEVKFQLKSNDQAPSNPVSHEDICNTLCVAVQRGWIQNNESDMKAFVSDIKHCHGNTKNKGIKESMRLCGTYVDFQTWQIEDIKSWLKNNSNYVVGGSMDNQRNQYGWSVKEGYENEFFTNAIKRFADTGKESYFICHTKTPSEKETIEDRREKMNTTFLSLENSLKSVFDFYSKEGRFPWHVEGFLPQDNTVSETVIVK